MQEETEEKQDAATETSFSRAAALSSEFERPSQPVLSTVGPTAAIARAQVLNVVTKVRSEAAVGITFQ